MSRDRKIIEAAARLFHERGFAGVSVDEIGESAGVTGPAIYRHFRGKEEILTSIFDEALDGLLEATLPDGESGRARLESIVRAHARYVEANSEYASIWSSESSALAPSSRRRFLRRTKTLLDRWATVVTDVYPERDADEIEAAVLCSIGLVNALTSWPKHLDHLDRRVDLVTTMAVGALDAALAPAGAPAP